MGMKVGELDTGGDVWQICVWRKYKRSRFLQSFPHADEVDKEKGFQNIRWIQAGGMISTQSGVGGFGVAVLEQ